MPKLGNFNLVVSAYLLNYAADGAMLTAMCQRILDNLADDGMFIHLGLYPNYRHEEYEHEKLKKYGVKITSVTPMAEGLEFRVSLLDQISFAAHHLPMPNLRGGPRARRLHQGRMASIEGIR